MTEPFRQADGTRKALTAGEDAAGRLDAWLAADMAALLEALRDMPS